MLVFDRGLGGDGWAGFALLDSLADDGDVWLENNHRGVLNGLLLTRSGHLVSQYPPGIVLLDAAPFWAGRALDRLLPARLVASAEVPPVGRVPRRVFLSAALIVLARNAAVLLGLVWIALALRRFGLPDRRAAAAVAFTFFGGPLLFYSLVGMTHAPTFALAALLLFVLVRQRETGSLGLAATAGALVGGAVLVRYSAVALLLPAVWALSVKFLPSPGGGWKGDGRGAGGEGSRPAALTSHWLRAMAACLAGFSLLLLPLPFWWRVCFGSWLPPAYGGQWVITAASPWNVLFGPVHGLFLFHPALLCATAGLLFLSLPSPPLPAGREGMGEGGQGGEGLWRATAAIWFLSVAVLHGWWSESANPGGYGQRFLIDALPALGLGFAGWLRPGRWRLLRIALALAATFAGGVFFFAAVGGLVTPPAPWPWPQRLDEYTILVRHPPRPSGLWQAMQRSSFLLRALAPR